MSLFIENMIVPLKYVGLLSDEFENSTSATKSVRFIDSVYRVDILLP